MSAPPRSSVVELQDGLSDLKERDQQLEDQNNGVVHLSVLSKQPRPFQRPGLALHHTGLPALGNRRPGPGLHRGAEQPPQRPPRHRGKSNASKASATKSSLHKIDYEKPGEVLVK
jgi:hypothetical protein